MLADTVYMSIPDGVIFPTSVNIDQVNLDHNPLLLATLLSHHNDTLDKMETFIQTILDRYQELKVYLLCDVKLRT